MRGTACSKKLRTAVLLTSLLLTLSLGIPARADVALPWEMSNSVQTSQTLADGRIAVLSGVVACKIAARNNPAYFVVQDPIGSGTGRKIVVLAPPPAEVNGRLALEVTGTMGTLPNGERCITRPTIYGYFDSQSRPVPWAPVMSLAPWRKGVLALPSFVAVCPSDPSLPDDGFGISAVPTAASPAVAAYDSVASLVAAEPSVLSVVSLSCKKITEVGEGYVAVGDDDSDANIKVYTNAAAKLTDRVLSLTGSAHTENGALVLYADNGPAPYFDANAAGSMSVVGTGTESYAATLAQQPICRNPGRVSVQSIYPSSTANGNWVYLTGRIVTGKGAYYTGSAPSTYDATNVYYIQGPDRTPGIRVWQSDSQALNIGDVVDIMAQVTTPGDGERMLGDGSDPDSVERVRLGDGDDDACNLAPFMMLNRHLCGGALGNNPSIGGGVGTYNIGSRTRTCGRVVGKGYCSDGLFGAEIPYIQIDDGSATGWDEAFLEGLCIGNVAIGSGIVVIDPPIDISSLGIGDYVGVTGISSLWLPDTTSYPVIRFATAVDLLGETASAITVTATGDVPISVTVYGTPSQAVKLRVATNTGVSWSPSLTLDQYGVGTYSTTWAGVPSELDTDGDTIGDKYPNYTVSAQCEGFKTRTATYVVPGASSVDLYLVPLRKVYPIQTTSYHLDPCSSPSAALSVAVKDADHNPIVYNGLNPPSGSTVRFWTDTGTFASDGSTLHTIDVHTDSAGVASVPIYAGYPSSSVEFCHVMATDDLNVPMPDAGDPYGDLERQRDWVWLASDDGTIYGKTYLDIGAYNPTLTVTPASSPAPTMKHCDSLLVTVTVVGCGSSPVANSPVTFTITGDGTIDEATEAPYLTYSTNTNSSGVATAHISSTITGQSTQDGIINLSVVSSPHGVERTQYRTITAKPHSPSVTITPDHIGVHTAGNTEITFTVNSVDGSARSGFALHLSTSVGSFQQYSGYPLTDNTVTTDANGVAKVYLHLDSPQSGLVTVTYTDDCDGQQTRNIEVRGCLAPWIVGVGTDYSSPLVANLVPEVTGQSYNELALIPKVSPSETLNGKVAVWNHTGSTGTAVCSDAVDSAGTNTLSAANTDNNSGGYLRIVAPYRDSNRVGVFGYESSFKPLAGWPVSTPAGYAFYCVSAAAGDANLDGSTKVAAGDESCFVMCWNGVGQQLWLQVTGTASVTIDSSSVAIGQVNTTTDLNRPPVAVVGAMTTPGLWGYDGDEWHDYYTNPLPGPQYYHYTTRWTPSGSIGSIQSSPAIGPIDNDTQDSINDVAVGSNDDLLWVWLSKDSQWHSYDAQSPIKSSPALADYNGQHVIVFGCDNGRVYAIRWNGTALVDCAGWAPSGTSGILLDGSAIKASPIVGDVLGDTLNPSHEPQVVVASESGTVYALWFDGTNHSGGAQAHTPWVCTQQSSEMIHSTPTLCSLDGSTLSLIVVSTNDTYKIDLFSTALDPYAPGNGARWPWPTFHHDRARTGCSTIPSTTMRSASIVGRVVRSGVGLPGASVRVQYSTDGTNWYDDTSVYGRSGETRANPITSVGTSSDEINKGGFVINQLTPGRRYRLIVSYGGSSTTYYVNGTNTLPAGLFALPTDISM